jgi:hypothetical protein
MKCVAVTAQEWLLWIEMGVLRCADRIVVLQDPCEHGALEQLLSKAPDFPLSADSAIVIAVLRELESFGLFEGSLDLGAVVEFIPLTAHGAKVLSRDATCAGVRFAAPRFEESFRHWQGTLRRRFSHDRGMRFQAAAGFQVPSEPATRLSDVAEMITRKPKVFPKIERKRNRVYFGWAIALSKLGERVPADRWREIRRVLKVEDFLKSLVDRPASRAPIGTELDVRRFARILRKSCIDAGINDCLVLRDSVVAHWTDFLEMSNGSGMEEDRTLRALGKDLRVVEADEGQESAAIAAYCVAQSMRAEIVSHLFYVRRPSDFPSLRLSAPHDWMGEQVVPISDLPEVDSESTLAVESEPPTAETSIVVPPEPTPLDADERCDAVNGDRPADIPLDPSPNVNSELSPGLPTCLPTQMESIPDHDGATRASES